MPTRTAQGDILSTALLSHGDAKQIMIIPASVEECYTMSMEAFDLAERFQSVVFVMSDLDLAMNTWMSWHAWKPLLKVVLSLSDFSFRSNSNSPPGALTSMIEIFLCGAEHGRKSPGPVGAVMPLPSGYEET